VIARKARGTRCNDALCLHIDELSTRADRITRARARGTTVIAGFRDSYYTLKAFNEAWPLRRARKIFRIHPECFDAR